MLSRNPAILDRRNSDLILGHSFYLSTSLCNLTCQLHMPHLSVSRGLRWYESPSLTGQVFELLRINFPWANIKKKSPEESRWIRAVKTTYTDPLGVERTWESTERTVIYIPILQCSGTSSGDCLISTKPQVTQIWKLSNESPIPAVHKPASNTYPQNQQPLTFNLILTTG